jgi:LmbE family N-acetylglucosaminyl deacetylase
MAEDSSMNQQTQAHPQEAQVPDPDERTRSRWWGTPGAVRVRRTPRPGTITVTNGGAPRRDLVASALSAAAVWIRKQRDKRATPAADVVSAILDRIGTSKDIAVARNIAVIVAHPDDEAIGAGAALRNFPEVTVVHVTDGAPGDEGYAQSKGFASPGEYAAQRRREVVAALGVIGIPAQRIRGLGIVDGETAWHLVELTEQIADLLDELQPEVVLTHPYEGGHSDHDSTAFAVHLATGMLQRDGKRAPIILELTSYHNYNGRRRLFSFLPFGNGRVKTVRLTREERRMKREMFKRFTSQLSLLKTFPVSVERFREAPRYLFTVPPHEGQLDYERLCKKMTGAEWRANAEKALEALRTRKQFRGM